MKSRLSDVGEFALAATLVLLALFLVAATAIGCDQLREQPAPPKPVDIPHVQFHGDMPTDRVVEIITEDDRGGSTEKAGSQGAGLTATGEKAQTSIDASAPGVNLTDGGGATGGDTIGKAFGQTDSQKIKVLCFVTGLLLIAGGAAGFKFLHQRMFLGVAALGVGVLSLALVPWYVAAGIGCVAVGLLLWFALRDTHLFRESTRAVAAGVNDIGPLILPSGAVVEADTIKEHVKSFIAGHASEADKRTIKAIKKADDLTN